MCRQSNGNPGCFGMQVASCPWACKQAPAAADAEPGRRVAHGNDVSLQGSKQQQIWWNGRAACMQATRGSQGSVMLLNFSCNSNSHQEQGSYLLQATCGSSATTDCVVLLGVQAAAAATGKVDRLLEHTGSNWLDC